VHMREGTNVDRCDAPKWFIRQVARYDGGLSWPGDVPCVARLFACAR
jgi:hypothetical protein